jgi:carboxypeptidase Taq
MAIQKKLNELKRRLTEKIYQHIRKFTTNELVKRVTDNDIEINPYIQYLKSKYSKIYGIDL